MTICVNRHQYEYYEIYPSMSRNTCGAQKHDGRECVVLVLGEARSPTIVILPKSSTRGTLLTGRISASGFDDRHTPYRSCFCLRVRREAHSLPVVFLPQLDRNNFNIGIDLFLDHILDGHQGAGE